MASTSPINGTVLNINDGIEKVTGRVAVSLTLGIGLVYQDGSNGWKNSPTNGTIHADQLYWNPTILVSTATLGDIVGTFYGEGARVIGTADGVLTAGGFCKASTNHENQFIALADPVAATIGATFGGGTATEAAIDAIRDWQRNKIARYLGHPLEVIGTTTDNTDAANEETNCVFEITRG